MRNGDLPIRIYWTSADDAEDLVFGAKNSKPDVSTESKMLKAFNRMLLYKDIKCRVLGPYEIFISFQLIESLFKG